MLHPNEDTRRPIGTMPRKKEMSQKIQVILPDDQIEWLQDRIASGDAETVSQAIRLVIRKEMRKNEDE